jgi:hypothetical protein
VVSRQRYRTNAEECLRLARNVNSPELHAILTTLANGWYRLAQDAMRTGTVTPHEELISKDGHRAIHAGNR